MTAIILVWNPDEWNEWTYPAVLEEVAEKGWYLASWEVSDHVAGGGDAGHRAPGGQSAGNPAAASGAEAWLVLQGRHGRGLIGHGVIVSERPAPRWQTPSAQAPAAQDAGNHLPLGAQDAGNHLPPAAPLYVRVAFDALLRTGDQIPPGVLTEAVPGIGWEALHGSGLAVDPADEALLRGLWSEFGPQPADPPSRCPAPSRRQRSAGSGEPV